MPFFEIEVRKVLVSKEQREFDDAAQAEQYASQRSTELDNDDYEDDEPVWTVREIGSNGQKRMVK